MMTTKETFGAMLVLLGIASGVWWLLERRADAPVMARIAPAEHGAVDVSGDGLLVSRDDADSSQVVTQGDAGAYSDLIRQRVAHPSRSIKLPPPPAMRSPAGEIDPLQCAPTEESCDPESPLFAKSWDEAQWMRSKGFVDPAQLQAAVGWSDAELDRRVRLGDAAAVAELARRFVATGEELAAKEVLADGVRNGNVFAAHRLAAIDEGRSLSFNSRPGLEWLLIARRMGDTQVDMSYIMARYPNLGPSELDHSMLVADRRAEQLGLNGRRITRRPER